MVAQQTDYGFVRPPEGSMNTMAMVPWYNKATGDITHTNSGGWTNKNSNWVRGNLPENFDPTLPVNPRPPIDPTSPVNPTDSTGFVQPVQSEQSANPGFTQQAPTQANISSPQTFYPLAAPVPTPYGAPSFVSPPSLAPTGAGLPRDSTSYNVGSPGSGGSDFPWGTVAGAGALAALLAAQDDDGSGLSFDNILSGAEKLFDLGDMSGKNIFEMLPDGIRDALGQYGYPSQTSLLESGTSALTEAQSEAMVKALGGTEGEAFGALDPAGYGTPQPPAAPSGGGSAFNVFDSAAVPISELGSATAAQAAATGNAMIATGGAYAPSYLGMGMGSQASFATQMGGMPATAAAAAGATAAPIMGVGAPGLMFGPTAGAATAVPAGGFAAMGAAGPLALAAAAFMAMQAMKDPPDPTLNTRRLNQIENMMQGGGGGIAALEEFLYNEPYTLDLIKDVTSGGGRAEPFGTPHTSGGTNLISWSPNVSKEVQENMHLLEAASHAGQVAGSQGMDTPPKQAAYSDIKRGATFNAANDPFGHREREAAAGGEWGDFPSYVPSGRDLNALINQDVFTP